LTQIITKTSGDYTFEVLTTGDSLMEGYSPFYVGAYDKDGSSIASDLQLNLIMEMDNMMHSTPFTTKIVTLNGKEYIEVDATFLMPNTFMDKWQLVLTSDKDGIDEKIALSVLTSSTVQEFTYNDKVYYLTIKSFKAPKVGIDSLVVSVHTAKSMTEYETVPDLTIEAEPFMPSMGHGSSGDKGLVYSGDGIYRGLLNINMNGLWEIRFTIKQDGVLIGSPVYIFFVM
jgi:hypothetical protein